MADKPKQSRMDAMRAETRKIVWPTKEQTVQYTLIVVAIAAAVAVVCWVLDLAFNALVGLVI